VSFINFLTGRRLVEKIESPINGEVRIIKVFGRLSIEVEGIEQSGSFVKGIWKKGLKKIHNSKFIIHNSLILGLGGGSVAELVNNFWPEAKIVGIEIDPVIIKLAKKYFALNKIANLRIINDDAVKIIKKAKPASRQGGLKKQNFDLILVDLYFGDRVLKETESPEFLENINRLISPNGLVIFNRLFYREKKKQTEVFIKKVKKIFLKTSFVHAFSNLLIFAQRRYN
jgi:spermidine synthase